MHDFNPVTATIGGLLVGIATLAYLLLTGRYAGLSGIVRAPSTETLAFACIGGAFVGFGTMLGRGCTSGHGVCGLGRLSRRSLAAVLTFISTGIGTVFVVRLLTGHA